MDEESRSELEYQKGFNDGYIITKFDPEMAEQLSKATGENIHLSGFKEGRKQYQLELLKGKRPAWLKEEQPDYKSDALPYVKEKNKGIER